MPYRTGRPSGVTIVREGKRTPEGHVVGADQLVAVVTNGDTALAERICALLNAEERGRNYAGKADPRCVYPDGVCTCGEPEGNP
jgi:hypothetical protein